jgi:hypothetical protein
MSTLPRGVKTVSDALADPAANAALLNHPDAD